MYRIILYLLLFVLVFLEGKAQNVMSIHSKVGGGTISYNIESIDSVTFSIIDRNWFSDININNCIDEIYAPSLLSLFGDDCYISSFCCNDCGIRLYINNSDDSIVAWLKEDASSFTSDYFKYGSISPILDWKTGKTIGYCKLRYADGGYVNSGIHAEISPAIESSLEYNKIASMLKGEQIVLLGDSKFGLSWNNLLPDMLMGLCGCQVINLGFGGCRMAWLTGDGSDSFDSYSFSSICQSLSNGEFERQGNPPIETYWHMIHNLQSIDLTRPTTIICNFGTNDITSSIEIGSLESIEKNYSHYDRTTFVGAMCYGVKVLKERFPHIRFIFLSPDYRLIDNKSIDDYINLKGLKIENYYHAMEEACKIMGVEFVDSYHLSFRNPQVIEDYTVDGTHFNGKGFSEYAKFLYCIWRFQK